MDTTAGTAMEDDGVDESPLRQLLKPMDGPSDLEAASGRRLLLTRLEVARARKPHASILGRLRPVGALAGLALFGVVAVGAGAAGLGKTGTLDTLFETLGTDFGVNLDTAAEHVTGLPPRDLPPQASGEVENPQDLAPIETLGSPPADAGAHGEAVVAAVIGALGVTGQGATGGPAVGVAACKAAQDRSTLPAVAQGKGPEAPQACGSAEGLAPTAQNLTNGQGNAPLEVPPVNPANGTGGSNPVGAPPAAVPPVVTPPENPGGGNAVGAPPSGLPPVAAPPEVGPGSLGGTPPADPGLGTAVAEGAGAPNPPEVPTEAVPPVTPGVVGTPEPLPPEPPGKPGELPGGRP